MLSAIYKRFAEDLIRETCASIYFDSSKNIKREYETSSSKKPTKNDLNRKPLTDPLSTAHSQDGLDYQKFPQYLSVTDIFETIQQHQRYDFLTNKNMAKFDN
jgi:hypothetical protein